MLKYYKLNSIKGEGWAVIVIETDTGFFATVSDWGNYAFLWVAPGGEFRAFLTELEPDYLYGKLMMGRPDSKVWDEDKTEDNVRQHLEDKNKEVLGMTGKGWAHYEAELEILRERTPMDKEAFEAWESETQLTDVWEFAVYSPASDCMGFCTKVWPRFVELLKKELEEERPKSMNEQYAHDVRAAEDAAFAKHIDAVVAEDAKSSITKEWAEQAAKDSAAHEDVDVQASRPTGKAMTGPDRNG